MDATCAGIEKRINEITNQMVESMKQRIAEYSQCFSHSRDETNLHESDSSLGSPKFNVSLYDDFESSYLARPNLNDDMPLPSLEQESDPPLSLFPNHAPELSSSMDALEDFLISVVPPITFNDSTEFEESKALESTSELDMSITTEIEHHNLDELEAICF